MKRMKAFFVSLALLICCMFCGCIQFGPAPDSDDVSWRIENVSEHRVIIYIDNVEEVKPIYGVQWMLTDVMDRAKLSGELTFESSAGFITSINGVENTADFSACWMLYTSDAEMANSEWGTITVGEQTLGSAIVGAEALEVLEGALYVWEYVTF